MNPTTLNPSEPGVVHYLAPPTGLTSPLHAGRLGPRGTPGGKTLLTETRVFDLCFKKIFGSSVYCGHSIRHRGNGGRTTEVRGVESSQVQESVASRTMCRYSFDVGPGCVFLFLYRPRSESRRVKSDYPKVHWNFHRESLLLLCVVDVLKRKVMDGHR